MANKLYFIGTCYPKVTIHSHLEIAFFETMVHTDVYKTFAETIPKMSLQDRVKYVVWKKTSFNNMRFQYRDYVGVQMSCLCWTGSIEVTVLKLVYLSWTFAAS